MGKCLPFSLTALEETLTAPFLKQLFMPMAHRQLEQGTAIHSQEIKGQMFPLTL